MNPILLYHAVSDSPGDLIAPYSVTPDTFNQHLDVIAEEGFRTLTFSELLEAWSSGQSTERTVCITFDDGYFDFATHALPALQERSMTTTLYLTTGFLEGDSSTRSNWRPSDKMLHWDQIRELADSGVEIGAHSHSHPHLDTLTNQQLREEVGRPKQLLENVLQSSVNSYAYPHGYCGKRVQLATRRAGYLSAAGVRHMISHSEDNRYNIARLLVEKAHSLDDLRGWLRSQGADKAQEHESVKTRIWRAYRQGRALVSRQPVNEYRHHPDSREAD